MAPAKNRGRQRLSFNKIDLLDDPEATIRDLRLQFPGSIFVSAATGSGLNGLAERMQELIERDFTQQRLLIPHERYDLVARIHREGGVRKEEVRDDGTYVVGTLPDRLMPLLEPYFLKADQA